MYVTLNLIGSHCAVKYTIPPSTSDAFCKLSPSDNTKPAQFASSPEHSQPANLYPFLRNVFVGAKQSVLLNKHSVGDAGALPLYSSVPGKYVIKNFSSGFSVHCAINSITSPLDISSDKIELKSVAGLIKFCVSAHTSPEHFQPVKI